MRPDTSMLAAVLDYVDEKTRRGEYRPSTSAQIRYRLCYVTDQLGNPPASRLSRRHVLKMLEIPGSAGTRRCRYSAMKGFCEWLVERGVLAKNPTLGVKPPKEPRRLPRGLDSERVARVLDAASNDRRLTLMLLLMVQEGLRCGEVAGLQIGDIDFNERTLFVTGKGGHQRVLPVSDETWAALHAYLVECPAGASGPVIRSRTEGNRYQGINAKTTSRVVGRAIAAAGIKGSVGDGVSAHAFRHTAATDALRNGAHVRDVQAMLGHASLSTTERYLAWHVKGLREAMGGRRYREAPPVVGSVAVSIGEGSPYGSS